jgi:lysophospholipase L1-like esterase
MNRGKPAFVIPIATCLAVCGFVSAPSAALGVEGAHTVSYESSDEAVAPVVDGPDAPFADGGEWVSVDEPVIELGEGAALEDDADSQATSEHDAVVVEEGAPVEGEFSLLATRENLEETVPAQTNGLPDGWNQVDGQYYWVEDGAIVTFKAFVASEPDGSSSEVNWYWADADGTIARNKDVWIGSQSKWVRFDERAHMIKGEDFRYGGWYLFDEVTGEMLKGFRYINSSGGKNVYYDKITGQMVHGEAYVDYDEDHNGWYMFDEVTGAMRTGMTFVMSNGGKWVYYDVDNGVMAHGEKFLSYDSEHNGWYLFDEVTGAVQYGFQYLSGAQKWVYYDPATAIMAHDERYVGDGWCLFDSVDGSLQYGWKYLESGRKWVHYDGITGRMQYGKQTLGGVDYYFDGVTGGLLNAPADFNPWKLSAEDKSTVQVGSLIKSGQVTSVRLIGDSVFAGIGCQDWYSNEGAAVLITAGATYYEPSRNLPSAANLLRSDFSASGVSLLNASIPGIGCMNFYSQHEEAAEGCEDLVVVMVGANDRGAFDSTETLAQFVSYSERFVSALAKQYGVDRVIVCSSTPTLLERDNFTIEQEDAVLKALCSKKCWSFVSIHDNFSKVAAAEGFDLAQLFNDGLHPNKRGQYVLYRTLSESLNL